MLKIKHKRVSQIPLLVGWVLENLNIKTNEIKMAIGIVGTNVLNLVNIKIPKPRMNNTMGK